MTRETLTCAFDTFAQADHSLDRSRGGLGLGLALVKGLAEMHGGSVTAESDGLGRGSKFTVRLPARRPSELRQPDAPPPATTKPLRILVVDDRPDAAMTLGILLEMMGHEIATAADGEEAFDTAHHFHPDLIISDIGLPKMDGFQLAQAIRNDSELCHVRMIALSGYGNPDDRRKALEVGFDSHLTKPVGRAELKRELATATQIGT